MHWTFVNFARQSIWRKPEISEPYPYCSPSPSFSCLHNLAEHDRLHYEPEQWHLLWKYVLRVWKLLAKCFRATTNRCAYRQKTGVDFPYNISVRVNKLFNNWIVYHNYMAIILEIWKQIKDKYDYISPIMFNEKAKIPDQTRRVLLTIS